MQLPNPKELKALLKVCREFGVSDVKVGELEVKFGDLPQEAARQEAIELSEEATPSDEVMAFWSSQPDPLAEIKEQ